MVKKTWQRLNTWLASQVSAIGLRWFEVILALALAVDIGWRFWHWREALTDWGFRLTPDEMYRLGYVRTFPLPPVWAIPIIGVVILAGVGAVIYHKWRRLGLFICLAAAIWNFGTDPWTVQALNRIHIGCFFVLATGPALRRDEMGQWVTSPALIWVLQATVVIIYCASGYTKAFQGDWLESNRCLWNIIQGYHRTDFAALLLRNTEQWMWTVMQHATLAFELGAPLWFALRWTRLGAVLFGIGLHVMIMLLMHRLYFFSLTMLAFYPLFIPEAWLRCVGEIFRRGPKSSHSPLESSPRTST
jgi:hypothetical protein